MLGVLIRHYEIQRLHIDEHIRCTKREEAHAFGYQRVDCSTWAEVERRDGHWKQLRMLELMMGGAVLNGNVSRDEEEFWRH